MMPGEDSWDVPAEALVTPVPLIGFVGLQPEDESQAHHRKVWELFSSNRGLDRHPLNFLILNLDNLELPVAKPPRTSYEWYLPRGILKRNWMSKHLYSLPSVIVLFFSSPSLSIVSSAVSKVRMSLTNRQTKLAVVLLQDDVDQDTITSICTECSIPVRAVYCLPPAISHPEPSLLEFEETIQELASNYYHAQIKNIKSHRDHLNKATHLQLLVRHSFKIGFLSEVKGDLNSAYKSYTSAYLLLLESRLTEHNSCELRCVAGLLNYKICKLAFKLNLPRDAIGQLRKHLDQWRGPPCPPSLSWEHAAWQSCQASHFAQLFVEACKSGQTAIQTQHPGVYFHLAAEYSISRRKLADSQCSSVMTYPSPDPLEGLTNMEFYGQRPWRVGKSEPSDMGKEKEGIDAMLFRERRVKHSQSILDLLSQAGGQFNLFKCPRMVTKLTIQQAEEMMVMSDYKQALQILLPCLPTYRQDAWSTLTYSVLSTALKCAFLSCDLNVYATLCLELCGLPSSGASWMEDEQKRVWSNLLQVLEAGKPPLPEPSLTAKSERASVGNATKNWTTLLSQNQNEEINITEFDSCIDVIAQMPSSIKSNEEVKVKLRIKYQGEGEISIRKVQCFFTNNRYDNNCKSEEVRVFTEAGCQEFDFSLVPDSEDVGKALELSHVSMLLGSREVMMLELVKKCPSVKNGDQYFKSGADDWQSVCKVDPQESNFNINIIHNSPVLVGEWFVYRVEIENTQDEDASDLEITCSLRDKSDPLLADTTILSLTPETPSSPPTSPGAEDTPEPSSVIARLEQLPKSSKSFVEFYIQASTGGERVIVMQMSCLLGQMKCLDSQTFVLNVEQPFEFVTTYLSEALEETSNCNTDEEFFVNCSVKNNSEHSLVVVGATLEGSHPVSVSSKHCKTLDKLDLLPESSVDQLFGGIVPSENMLAQLDSQTIIPGKLVMTWTRTGSSVKNQTIFDLPSIKLSRASLYAECLMPPYGVLRTQLQIRYVFHNRTQDIQQFLINIEPSDSFMFSGPKQSQIKLFPLGKHSFSLIIYPLVCGLSQLPKVKISTTEGNVAQDVLERLFPSSLVVVPKEKNDRQRKLDMDKFILTAPVKIENLPYTSKKAVKT